MFCTLTVNVKMRKARETFSGVSSLCHTCEGRYPSHSSLSSHSPGATAFRGKPHTVVARKRSDEAISQEFENNICYDGAHQTHPIVAIRHCEEAKRRSNLIRVRESHLLRWSASNAPNCCYPSLRGSEATKQSHKSSRITFAMMERIKRTQLLLSVIARKRGDEAISSEFENHICNQSSAPNAPHSVIARKRSDDSIL